MSVQCRGEIAGQETELGTMSFRDLVTKVIAIQPPKDPFSYRLEFLNDMTPGKLRVHLLFLAIQVANERFGKKLADCNYAEVDKIQKYIHSIGFQIRYEPDDNSEKVQAGADLSELTIRDFKLFFEPAPSYLRPN